MKKTLMTISMLFLLGSPMAFSMAPDGNDDYSEEAVDQEQRHRGQHRRAKAQKGQHKKMMKLRNKILRKRVKLDEETLARVQAIFKSFDGERKVLHLAKRDTMKAIRDLIRNDSEDQESYATLLLAAKQAHNALAQLRTEEFAQLSGVLTPKQQALLMMSLQKLKRKMMGMRGKRGKRGGEGHRGPRHRRGLDNEGGGYGPPPHRGFGSRGGRSSGVDEVDDDLLDL